MAKTINSYIIILFNIYEIFLFYYYFISSFFIFKDNLIDLKSF